MTPMMRPTLLYRVMTFAVFPLVAIAAVLLVDLILHPFEASFGYSPFWHRWLYGLLFPITNMVIGILCMRRAPGNVIGPLLTIYGAGSSVESLRASFDPMMGAFLFFTGTSISWEGFFFLVSLFPDGKPYPHWMRWVLRFLIVVLALYTTLFLLGSPNFIHGPDSAPNRILPNPLYSPSVASALNTFLGFMFVVGQGVFIVCLPLSIFLRYRTGNQSTRSQLRWMLWGVTFMMTTATAQQILLRLNLVSGASIISQLAGFVVLMLPAIAVGNAILRHKLYDIDIIIRRTLIYAVLTTILGLVYFGGIVVTQQAFKALTGQTSDLAIVVSTLLIAALFAPLRRRVQDVIDRRLYRKKYDAEKVLVDFQKNLRDEVNMETLKANLIGVVSDTMQPDKIALWVKESPRSPTS